LRSFSSLGPRRKRAVKKSCACWGVKAKNLSEKARNFRSPKANLFDQPR
jgi:hypothetical protein